jgi:hypothetical protein
LPTKGWSLVVDWRRAVAETSVRLGNAEAVLLAHGLTARLAADARIRLLSIKGPVLSYFGLRGERHYADADVWVEPGRVNDFIAVMNEHGWFERFERPTARILADHSVTLVHAYWPIDIDVHWYFPGFFGEPHAVFDEVWSRRAEAQFAHTAVQTPGLLGSIVIAGLHYARHPDSGRHQGELATLVSSVQSLEPAPSMERLAELCLATGALPVLAPLLQSLGVASPTVAVDDVQFHNWQIYIATHDSGSTAAWLVSLRAAPLLSKPLIAWRALYPSSAEIDAMHAADASTPRGRSLHRIRRLIKGLRAAPSAIATLRRLG